MEDERWKCDQTEEQWNGLIPLLDDDSVVVRQGLLEHFLKKRRTGSSFFDGNFPNQRTPISPSMPGNY